MNSTLHLNKTKKDILIVGPPRSGTTWVGKVLSVNDGVKYVHEPDNERVKLLGYYYKNGLHRFPYLKPKSKNNNYLKLFKKALKRKYLFNEDTYNYAFYKVLGISKEQIENELGEDGFNKKNRKLNIRIVKRFFEIFYLPDKSRKVVKSVHACLSVPYLDQNFDVDVLVIIRNPFAVVSSYIRMKMPEADRYLYKHPKVWNDFIKPYEKNFNELSTPLEFYGFQIGLFHHVLKKHVEENKLLLVKYEEFYPDPSSKFKELYQQLGLKWTSKVEKVITQSNKVGKGYNTNRDIKKQFFDWQKHLTKEHIEQIKKGYNVFDNQFYTL